MLEKLHLIKGKKRLVGFLLICILFFQLVTKAENIPDTIHIEEIVISSENISRFQTGAKIEKIDVNEKLEFEERGVEVVTG